MSSSALQKTACTIPAHDGPLAALTFNSTGSKLASASEKVSEHPPCCLSPLPMAGWGASAVWSMESGTSELGVPNHGQQRRGTLDLQEASVSCSD